MALTTQISLRVAAELTDALDLTPRQAQPGKSAGWNWASGVLANQADAAWADTRTLAASATEDLDLAGVLAGAFGTITFARVKCLVVHAAASNTNNVVIGAAATNTWVGPFGAATHTVALQPDGGNLWVAPGATAWPVTAGTGDLLKIANSGAGTSVTYDILIIGASS